MLALTDRVRQSAPPFGDAEIAGLPDIAHERKTARSLYLELRALGLDVWAEDNAEDPTGHTLFVEGPDSLPRARIQDLIQRARDNKAGLVEVLLCGSDPDLHAIRTEGAV